jgi:hypothetical protein
MPTHIFKFLKNADDDAKYAEEHTKTRADLQKDNAR